MNEDRPWKRHGQEGICCFCHAPLGWYDSKYIHVEKRQIACPEHSRGLHGVVCWPGKIEVPGHPLDGFEYWTDG